MQAGFPTLFGQKESSAKYECILKKRQYKPDLFNRLRLKQGNSHRKEFI